MLPYLLLLFVSAVFPLICYKNSTISFDGEEHNVLNEKRNKMTVTLFFFGLFILLALRDISVGTDLKTYKRIFESCIYTSFENLSNMQWERGYTFFCKALSLISKDYRFFLIVVAVITIIPIYKLYSKEKRYPFLILILFVNMPCFLMMFSGLRQAIAISIGVLVYMAIENRKFFLSFLLILLAVSFHVSAVALFLFYPAYHFQIRTKHLIWIVPALIGVWCFRISILTSIFSVLPAKYIEFYGEVQQTGAYGMMILFLIFSIFSFVVLDENKMTKKDFFMRNFLLISTVAQFFVPIHGLVQRASYYFLIFVPTSILSVVKAPKRMLKDISNFAVIVLSAFFLFYFFCNAMFSKDNLLDVFPYKFFWSDQY